LQVTTLEIHWSLIDGWSELWSYFLVQHPLYGQERSSFDSYIAFTIILSVSGATGVWSGAVTASERTAKGSTRVANSAYSLTMRHAASVLVFLSVYGSSERPVLEQWV